MRIVLDTNVFISGVFFSGPPFQILKAWRDRLTFGHTATRHSRVRDWPALAVAALGRSLRRDLWVIRHT